VKLMSAAHSGLLRYLSPKGGASAGLVPLQKALSALLAEIRHAAQPASLDSFPVSDLVEDHAPQAPLAVAKLERQLDALWRLLAIEAVAAAQAVDLRRTARLGAGAAIAHAFVREIVPMLVEDRPLGVEVESVARRLEGGELARLLAQVDSTEGG
jgi:histidine ammonia-lyase